MDSLTELLENYTRKDFDIEMFDGRINAGDGKKLYLVLFGGNSDDEFCNFHQGIMVKNARGYKYFDKYGSKESPPILDIRHGLRWENLINFDRLNIDGPRELLNNPWCWIPPNFKYDVWNVSNVAWFIHYESIENLTIAEIQKEVEKFFNEL